jgi:hypothetical protein
VRFVFCVMRSFLSHIIVMDIGKELVLLAKEFIHSRFINRETRE